MWVPQPDYYLVTLYSKSRRLDPKGLAVPALQKPGIAFIDPPLTVGLNSPRNPLPYYYFSSPHIHPQSGTGHMACLANQSRAWCP